VTWIVLHTPSDVTYHIVNLCISIHTLRDVTHETHTDVCFILHIMIYDTHTDLGEMTHFTHTEWCDTLLMCNMNDYTHTDLDGMTHFTHNEWHDLMYTPWVKWLILHTLNEMSQYIHTNLGDMTHFTHAEWRDSWQSYHSVLHTHWVTWLTIHTWLIFICDTTHFCVSHVSPIRVT